MRKPFQGLVLLLPLFLNWVEIHEGTSELGLRSLGKYLLQLDAPFTLEDGAEEHSWCVLPGSPWLGALTEILTLGFQS